MPSKRYNLTSLLLICVLFISCADCTIADCAIIVDIDEITNSKFEPILKAKDNYWRDSLPKSMVDDYIYNGLNYLNKPWTENDTSLFAQYVRNGNRLDYEKALQGKRKQLYSLAMAEVCENKGRFLQDIFNGLESLCEETYWDSPAFLKKLYPEFADQRIGLFSPEAGAMASWILYMFGDDIKSHSPELYGKVVANIRRRVIDEAINGDYWWKNSISNHNTWICANWLTCVLIVEQDPQKKRQALEQIANSLNGFVDKYPADGSCDEGTTYYDKATAQLLYSLLLLGTISKDALKIADETKLKNMAEFICSMDINGVDFVNFADADQRPLIRPEWYPGAKFIGSESLKRLVFNSADSLDYFRCPYKTFQKDNWGNFGLELLLLSQINELLGEKQDSLSLAFDSWHESTEIITGRSVQNSNEGLYFAAKGGNNNESHNHNDVGSFIVFGNGLPILIDPGRGVYDKAYFNEDRYNSPYTQSQYHNLPIINGYGQICGAQYKAEHVNTQISDSIIMIEMDIAKAYPDEAQVKSWKRKIEFKRKDFIAVSESYSLDSLICAPQLVFMSESEPRFENGMICFGQGCDQFVLCFESSPSDAHIECVKSMSLKKDTQSKALYRTTSKFNNDSLNGTINYYIKKTTN